MSDYILYTTDCPRCRVIKAKLNKADIRYSTVTSVDEMVGLGINEVPVLEVDGRRMGFSEALRFIGGDAV